MNTTFKTAKALTTEFIKTIKTAEKSNSHYLVALAKLAKDGKVSYDDLHVTNKSLNETAKETGITTFKNVAMIVGRMYDKKAVNGKSVPYDTNSKVIDDILSLGSDASMAKLQAVHKEGKEVQTKTAEKVAKTVTGTVGVIMPVDVKVETQSIRDEIINNAREIAKQPIDEVVDQHLALMTELEELMQSFDPKKNKAVTAVVNAKLQNLLKTVG